MLMMMKAPQNIKESKGATASASGRLLSLLVCPLTRGGLIYDARGMRLISLQAGLCYPIKGQVPIMLEEAATPLTEGERAKFADKPPPPSPAS